VPDLLAGGGGYPLPVEAGLYGLRAEPFGGKAEYLPHDVRLGAVDNQGVAGLVVAEAVGGLHGRYDLALASFLQLPPACPLRDFRPLELGELVEDAVRELALRGIVAAVVEGTDLSAMLLEFLPEQIVIGGLPSEAVPVLSQHHRNAASSHQVSHMVHAGPLQARPALTRVCHLLEARSPHERRTPLKLRSAGRGSSRCGPARRWKRGCRGQLSSGRGRCYWASTTPGGVRWDLRREPWRAF
jgi:hypothetical protein